MICVHMYYMFLFLDICLKKETVKQEMSNICQQWIKLITNHEKSLLEWIDSIEEAELDVHKSINNKLNDELELLKKTKSKCRGLMSFATVDDIFKVKEDDQNDDDSKETIVSLVDQCISKLDKSQDVTQNNIFDKLKFSKFNAETTKV